jgi:type I restriction enzyme M protein
MTQQPLPDFTPISQETINKTLWEACDTFRGTVDPSEYKNYILVMLFIKYLSDVWTEHLEQVQAEYANNPERVARKMKNEPFQMPAGSDFYSLYAKRNAPNIGEIIDEALSALEDANKEKLSGVFRNISFNSEAALGRTAQRNQRLINLLNDFNKSALNLRPSRVGNLDIIGNAYEYLIGRFASDAGKKAGEFYTPPEVSTLLAQLLDPQPNDRICDPACGSGSLLIKCAKQVGSTDYSIKGQELNNATWALCMMNMLLHGMSVTTRDIAAGDTIREPMLLEHGDLMRFDVVVANPPFSLDKWGADDAAKDRYNRFHRGIPPKSKGDYAFISHMVEVMADRGRMGVIVPHGVLFRGGAEGKIRTSFLDDNLLDAVIGLPPNLFYGTGIPAAILIFKKGRPDGEPVLFIDASRDFEQGTNQNKLRPEDLTRVLDTFRARQPVEKYAALATRAEIAENGDNLNIPRYVDTFEAEETIDLKAVNAEIASLEDQLSAVKSRMTSYLKELGLE